MWIARDFMHTLVMKATLSTPCFTRETPHNGGRCNEALAWWTSCAGFTASLYCSRPRCFIHESASSLVHARRVLFNCIYIVVLIFHSVCILSRDIATISFINIGITSSIPMWILRKHAQLLTCISHLPITASKPLIHIVDFGPLVSLFALS